VGDRENAKLFRELDEEERIGKSPHRTSTNPEFRDTADRHWERPRAASNPVAGFTNGGYEIAS
jgi:hypothetical protein